MFWKWKRKAQELERALEEARREVRQMQYKVDDLEYQVTLFRQRELKEWAQRQTSDIMQRAQEKRKQPPWKRDSAFWQIPPTNPTPTPIEPYFFYNQSPTDDFWNGNTEPNQSNTE